MKLSPDYTWRYALVERIKPGSDEVRFLTYKFFKSETKAWEWFRRKQKKGLNEVAVIPITAFHKLEMHEDDETVCADHD